MAAAAAAVDVAAITKNEVTAMEVCVTVVVTLLPWKPISNEVCKLMLTCAEN